MNYISCPVCGSDSRQVFMHGSDQLHNMPGEFILTRCTCGLVFINPQPANDELQAYYPDDYCPYRQRKIDPVLKRHHALKVFVLRWYYGCPVGGPAPRRWLRVLLTPVTFWLSLSTLKSMIPYHGDGKILDVGCGNGGWLLRLKHAGWDVQGVEIDEPAAREAAAAGIPTVCGTLPDAQFPDASFDVVRLHYVFEHLINPGEILDEIHRILKPGGICYIRIPNIDSVTFRLFTDYWFPLDIPRHVFHYSPTTFKRLAGQHGLHVKNIRFNSPSSGFFISIAFMRAAGTVPWYLNPLREKSRLWKNLWRPFGWLIDRFHKGDIVEYTLIRADEQLLNYG